MQLLLASVLLADGGAIETRHWLILMLLFLGGAALLLRPRRSPAASADQGARAADEDEAEAADDDDEAVAIDGELDLHHFQPKEVAGVVAAYVEAAAEKGIYELRIVHGKGKGTLRRTVHASLEKRSEVESFGLAEPHRGGWGATMVKLKRPPAD